MTTKLIKGAKGDEPRKPIDAPNNLKSTALVRVIDLVSEGEIVGLVDGLKSVYLDETPIQNADGTNNFNNITVEYRYGTQTQDHIAGFPSVENEIVVGVELKQSASVIRRFTDTNMDAVRVRLSTPQLTETNTDTGDVKGYTVNYVIEVSVDDGPYTTLTTSAFSGKCISKYERAHRLELPPATAHWDIRVRRTTPDSTTSTIQATTVVESMTEIIDAKFRYPNSAVIGVIMDAAQFQNIPGRAYHLKGRIVRVPSNYNAATRAYTGLWDGTYQLAWTDNPAWCFLDIVTNNRFGLGHLLTDAHINKWALYKIAQYCDELVPNGHGGTEPRFTCNIFLQTQNDAFKVVQDIATIFRGMLYWAGGQVNPQADKPEDPAYTYTPANVVDGKFIYHGTGKKARHTVALVTWNDPDNFYRSKVEYISDDAGIAKYGIQQTDIMAVGCTSQGQAQRLGRYALLTAQYETQTVEFEVGLDGTIVSPGSIIRIADPLRASARLGGRIHAATTTVVTLDSAADIAAGDELTVIIDGVAQTRTISAYNASTHAVTVSPAFSSAPATETVWAVDRTDLSTQRYRVISVGESGPNKYTVNAVEHNASKFDAVDYGTQIDLPTTSWFSDLPPENPQNVQVTSHDLAGQVNTGSVLTISWEKGGRRSVRYYVEYQRDDGPWIRLPATEALSVDITNAWAGTYRAVVVAENLAGVLSDVVGSEDYVLADQMQTPGFVQALQDDILEAMTTALDAADIADGAIMSFYQTTAPTGASEGDIWFDTAHGNKIYTYRSGAWVATPDSDIAAALDLAADAQSTADGKVKTWFQNAAPTDSPVGTLTVGDLWIDLDDANKLYRWSGSAWAPARDGGILTALANAATAQAAADGKIDSFFQTTAPTGTTYGTGDLWFDTDDGNKQYYWTGSAWVLSADTRIGDAILAAAGAQSTADGKIKTLFQAAAPSGSSWTATKGIGDLWIDTDDKNKLYRWDGSTWAPVRDTDIAAAVTAAQNAQAAADGKIVSFWQISAPAIGSGAGQAKVGDIWFDTDDGNKVYRVVGAAWTLAADDDMAAALGAASDAQSTADGKVTTWFQTSAPTAPNVTSTKGIGDLWFNTTSNKLARWNGTNWTSQVVIDVAALNTSIAAALGAGTNAQATADGKIVTFWQTAAPTIGTGAGQAKVGDIWFDTDDGNKIYRVVGAAWVIAADDDMAQALNDASDAQATADGKVTTFFKATAPTNADAPAGIGSIQLGDLWFNTTLKQLYRWNGTTWSDRISDITLDQLAGSGVNILWDEYSRFYSATMPPFSKTNGTYVIGADATAFGGYAMQFTTTGTNINGDLLHFGISSTDYNLPLNYGKSIVSFWAKSNVAGHQILIYGVDDTGTGHSSAAFAIGTSYARYSAVIDMTGAPGANWILRLYMNRSGVAGRTVSIDGVMIESMVGTQTTPSPYVPGKASRMAYNAIAAASAAQDTADGKIETYFQTAMPTVGVSLGDLWFDTDDGNKVWRHNGTTFVEIQDDAIAQAIANAAGAQGTADGKVTTYYKATAPTNADAPPAIGVLKVGDLWYDTTGKSLSRYSGTVWVAIADITADKMAGSGVNIMWEEYSMFSSSTLPANIIKSSGTISAFADTATQGGYALRMVTAGATNASDIITFGTSTSDYNLPVVNNGAKFIVSFRAKASVAGHEVLPNILDDQIVGHNSSNIALTTSWARYSTVITMAGSAYSTGVFRFYCNRSAVAGRTVYIDQIMIEPMVGNDATPSLYSPGPSARQTALSLANAAYAQSTADGKIETYFQINAPTPGPFGIGDLWFDTNDTNKQYYWNGSAWTLSADTRVGQAILDAAGAQATADGKVTTFYKTTAPTNADAPTGIGVLKMGDLWFNTTTKVLARYSGSAWVTNGGTVNENATANGAIVGLTQGANLCVNPGFAENTIGTAASTDLALNDFVADNWQVFAKNARYAIMRDAGTYASKPLLRLLSGAVIPASGSYQNVGIQSSMLNVTAGRTYNIISNAVLSRNATPPGTFGWLVRSGLNWYDATGAAIGSSNFNDNGSTVGAITFNQTFTAPAGAAKALKWFALYTRDTAGGTTSGLYTDVRILDCTMTELVNLDRDTEDGTTYGRLDFTDLYTTGGTNRLGLRWPGSGHRIGDQRNLPQSLTTAYGSTRTTTSLSATSAGAISVNAHTVRYGGTNVSYSAVANAVTGKAVGSTWIIYCLDDTYAGGVRTWFAGSTVEAVMNLGDGIVIAGVITIPSSGTGTGGSGGNVGGGSYGSCVDAEMLLPDGRRAGDLQVGDLLPCWNYDAENPTIEYLDIQAITIVADQPSKTLVTASGAMVTASDATPMTLRNGDTAYIPGMLGEDVLVRDAEGVLSWQPVIEVRDAGLRTVAKISVYSKCYFTGVTQDATIATHNALKP